MNADAPEPKPGDFLIRLRPLPDRVPADVRLRRLLKLALRRFRLRCVSVRTQGRGFWREPTEPLERDFRPK